MIREKFLEDLRLKALEKNLNVAELVEKYSRRFDLGLEAGMSESEIIDRFGNIDDLLCGLSGYKHDNLKLKKRIELLEINTGGLEKLIIESVSGDSINVKYSDPKTKDLYKVEQDEETFSLNRVKNIKNFKLSYDGAIKIEIGDLVEIGKLDLNLVNQQNDFTKYNLLAEDADINTVTGITNFNNMKVTSLDFNQVSGNTFIENLSCESMDLSTVSGNLSINNIDVDDIDISSTSGEINIAGNITRYDVSTISGVVTINGKVVNKTIAQAIKDAIRKRG